ncbi:MAG: hypothetical protein ACK4RG_10455, partial [Fimbriimonadales bacterium]
CRRRGRRRYAPLFRVAGGESATTVQDACRRRGRRRYLGRTRTARLSFRAAGEESQKGFF